MNKESLERALNSSLTIMLFLSFFDLVLYYFIETVVLTVIAHSMSVLLLIRYRLHFDLIKLSEISALLFDLYLISFYGYAVVSPIISLITIFFILKNKENHLNKLKNDLEKIMNSKKKDLEND